MRLKSAGPILLAAVIMGVAARCATMGQVNLQEPQCHTVFSQGISSILVAQGEKPEIADRLASRAAEELTLANFGPRPFLIASPSGADYTFFVQVKRPACLLRLYGRQKGFVSYTNNLTYIATRSLASCSCSE